MGHWSVVLQCLLPSETNGNVVDMGNTLFVHGNSSFATVANGVFALYRLH